MFAPYSNPWRSFHTQLRFTPQITNTAQLNQTTLGTQRVETCSYVFLWEIAWWRARSIRSAQSVLKLSRLTVYVGPWLKRALLRENERKWETERILYPLPRLNYARHVSVKLRQTSHVDGRVQQTSSAPAQEGYCTLLEEGKSHTWNSWGGIVTSTTLSLPPATSYSRFCAAGSFTANSYFRQFHEES